PVIPATAYASSDHPYGGGTRPPANVVNNSGMSDQDADGVPETHEANAYGDGINWMSNDLGTDLDPWLALDFGEVVPLDMMKVWNFNAEAGRTDRGVGTADVYVSILDDVGIADPDFSDTAVWTLLKQAQAFTAATGLDDYDTPDVIGLDGASARWLALDIQSTQGSTSFVGLSEIQVFRVPEPATLSLLALGGLGLIARRRRR
ncbi:PEP-CTERM sorting domain-containing protein, partial [Planctomycetota bacterium]